jgi:ketosteroid isomerase-like protein
MSEENLELVRLSYDALASGNLDAWLHFFDPDVEWLPPPIWAALEVGGDPEAQVLRGHAGIRRFMDVTGDMWEKQEISPERFLDAGDDQVVAFVRLRVRGRNGVEIDEPWAHLITLRSRKVVRFEIYPDRSEALEAAGLSE